MKRMLLALALFVAAVFVLPAQTGEWYDGKPIKDIKFTGLERVSGTELEGVIKPFFGQPLTAKMLDEIQRRLYDMDQFDSLIPDFLPADGSSSAVVLSFDVVERAVIDEIVIKGNDSQRTSDLLGEVVLKGGKPVNRPKIIMDEDNLRKYYIKNGYADIKVESSVEPGRKANNRKLVFTVTEGYRTSVRKVLLSGNKFASESTLKGLLKTTEQSLFNAGTFQEANLELDRQAIEKYYHDNGYIDARVSDINKNVEFSAADKRNYLTVTFYVEEGETWTFGGVTINGCEIFTRDRLMPLMKSKVGGLLNQSRLSTDYHAIADLYYQNGYINNSITMDMVRDEQARVVNVVINIVERGRAYIENIIIRGTKKTESDVILRALPFEPGDVFSSGRIREGMYSLTNLRYFSNVVPETPAGSVPGLYDLVLNLTEQNTIDLRLGFAISGDAAAPLSGFVRFADTNFLGKGLEFGGELSISAVEQKISLNYSDPWMLGPNWGAGITLGFTHTEKSGILQDIGSPVFSGTDSHAVPDPYDGHYVFNSDQNSGAYMGKRAGDAFPGVPNAAEIAYYGLVTDYAFAGGASSVDTADTMKYHNYEITLGLNTGKRERTQAGWFSWTVYGNVELNYVDYDQSKYRPYDYVLRDNYGKFQFINSLGAKLALDGRDITWDPGNGYYFSQAATLVGGFLGGSRHYIQTTSNIQAYLTLFELPVVDTWSWKEVLAFNSTLDVLFPQFYTYGNGGDGSKNFVASDRLLYTNPMTVARGWPSITTGQALWNNWLELRMPLVPQILSFDFFFDAVRIMDDRSRIFDFGRNSWMEGWMFGYGGGLRLLIQSLPLRLYVGKRFNVDSGGNVVFQKGNLFADNTPGSGVDLIFAFSLTN